MFEEHSVRMEYGTGTPCFGYRVMSAVEQDMMTSHNPEKSQNKSLEHSVGSDRVYHEGAAGRIVDAGGG